ncbi:MAG TPA: RodZ domain-containing protein [Anaerolineales bacterium]
MTWLAAFRRRLGRPDGGHQPAGAPDVAPDASAETAVSNIQDFNRELPEGKKPATSSDEIFIEIGQQLRARREMLSLTYEEIERHTHVRTVFLQALEQGAIQDLPSPVQARGTLVNYAGFLDLDVDSILLRFADGIQARYREKGPQKPARSRAPLIVKNSLPPLRSFIASDLVFGGGLAILLLLFAVWGINRVIAVRSEAAAQVTAPSISDILASTAVPTLVQQVTVIPAQQTPSPAAADASPTLELATLDPNVKVQVMVSATERTYMRITVDGKVQFEGRTDVGSTYSYQASEQVEILVGNAAALRVTYNGRELGLMGNFGEVVDRLYTVEGVATPTFTPAPTRTPTPKVTPTPTQTPTQTLTHTPSPTRTP